MLGRVPNIEKLKRLNIFGLKACFVLVTFGLANGFGLAMVKSTAIQMSILDWLKDAKIGLNTEKQIELTRTGEIFQLPKTD